MRIVFNLLVTRFGRRPLLLVSYLSSMTFAVISAFSPSYVIFNIMRFFTGMSLAGITIMPIALSKYAKQFYFMDEENKNIICGFTKIALTFLQMLNGLALNTGLLLV